MEGAMKCKANNVALTPISFLERAAAVYGERTSVVYGGLRHCWRQTRDRCHKLSSSLINLGVSPGDVVSAISPNTPAAYELHFAVPMAGAVVCVMSPYLIDDLLPDHIRRCSPKLLFVDHRYLDSARAVIHRLSLDKPLAVVAIGEPGQPSLIRVDYDYESLISSGDAAVAVRWPHDEWDAISISYTSGTTGMPKGAIYNHRAAFLNTMATIILMEMSTAPTFLWTVPLFHCNGWSFVWATAALGGSNVFLREMSAKTIFDAIVEHNVTALGGGTTLLVTIAKARPEDQKPLPHRVHVLAGGSAPPAEVLLRMEEQGFHVTHAGGQTETYGCAIYCVHHPEWEELPGEARARLQSRQGLPHLFLAQVDVKDPETMESVAADGETVGEVVYRGNNVMSGYLDREETEAAFRGSWFHSGDLGVRHPDGYVEFKDRMRDRVVRGGRTIGTIEIESMIHSHPAVRLAGVVWKAGEAGEEEEEGMLFAFVELKEGWATTAEEILGFCRARLPEEKVPDAVVFDELPFTKTGKLKKAVLREKANAISESIQRGSRKKNKNKAVASVVAAEGEESRSSQSGATYGKGKQHKEIVS